MLSGLCPSTSAAAAASPAPRSVVGLAPWRISWFEVVLPHFESVVEVSEVAFASVRRSVRPAPESPLSRASPVVSPHSRLLLRWAEPDSPASGLPLSCSPSSPGSRVAGPASLGGVLRSCAPSRLDPREVSLCGGLRRCVLESPLSLFRSPRVSRARSPGISPPTSTAPEAAHGGLGGCPGLQGAAGVSKDREQNPAYLFLLLLRHFA